MAKIPEFYNIGDISKLETPDLALIMLNMYRDLAIALNKKADVFERTTDGLVSDVNLSNGTININTITNKVEILTNHTSTTNVTWKQLS